MRLPRLLLLTAFLYGVVGAAFGLWPHATLRLLDVDTLSPLLGLEPDPARRMPFWVLLAFTRLFGTMLLGAGVIALCLRGVASPDAQKAVVTAFFAFNLIGGSMAFLQQLSILGWRGNVGWWLVSIFGVLAAAFGHLLLGARGVAAAGSGSGIMLGELRESWLRQVSEAAAQQERTRLARDLHDSIKQQLFTINVSAAASQERLEGDQVGAREALQQVRQAAHEAMAEMEAMLQHLEPVPLATVGLVEALRKQCESLGYRTGAAVKLEAAELPATGELAPGAESALFRIAQEALSNVARHARARNVRLRLERPEAPGPWALLLCIEDDGAGFDPKTVTPGMGLANLRARTHQIGALLELDSAPGRGTRVLVRVPGQALNASGLARQLQLVALLGIGVIWHLGLPGRPLVGGELFWRLLPVSVAAAWLAGQGLWGVRRGIASLASRLGDSSVDVLRLRALYAQCLGLLAVAAGAWNPISTWILYHLGPLFVARPLVGAGSSAGLKLQTPAPYAELALAAGLAVALTGWRVHRALAGLAACLPAGRLAGELRDGLEHWFPPLSALLGTIGISLVFLHEQTAALLPLLLLIWLAPVGYWFLRRRGVAMRAATAQRG